MGALPSEATCSPCIDMVGPSSSEDRPPQGAAKVVAVWREAPQGNLLILSTLISALLLLCSLDDLGH